MVDIPDYMRGFDLDEDLRVLGDDEVMMWELFRIKEKFF